MDGAAGPGLILRQHRAGEVESAALYSACEGYRYLLSRRWGPGPRILFVLLNPSTATEARNDPTLARCERRARERGFGAMRVANLFALRATDPRVLYRAADPVGPGNDDALAESARWADLILCGWGGHGALGARGAAVAAMLGRHRPLWHLGLTRAGHPRHPLYVANAAEPALWDQAAMSGRTST